MSGLRLELSKAQAIQIGAFWRQLAAPRGLPSTMS
jgi:hypothetical protein